MFSFWASLVGLFSGKEDPLVPVRSSSGGKKGDAETLVLELLGIYGNLKSMKRLKPCVQVNGLFGRLVDVCVMNRDSEVTELVLQDSRMLEIRSVLRKICDIAECSLESHWVDIIIGPENSTLEEVYERLSHFPYFQNYIDLTRLELSAINGVRNVTSPIRKIAFLGSGPLPLTSLCLCGVSGDLLYSAGSSISVLNIDNNALAISKSNILSEKLGLKGHGMEFLVSDAGSDEVDLGDFDVVYLAALVGGSQREKEKVLVSVVRRMSVGSLVVIRSADRLRRILYPAFDPCSEVVRKWVDVCVVVHPFGNVVNSVIVGRVKRRGLEEDVGKLRLIDD